MEKEEVKIEEQQPVEEPVTDVTTAEVDTPEEKAWFAGMESKYPDLKGDREALYKASREGYDAEHKLNKENADAYGKIYKAIESSPEAASFINKLTNPEEGAEPEEAFAEFGEDLVDLLTGKIDNETYRTKKKEFNEKKSAIEAAENERNIKAGEAFVEACKEIGIEPEEAEKKLVERYNDGGDADFRVSKGFYTALLKSLTYDDDMVAAEARGRNAQMAERNNRRSAESDGLPHSNGTVKSGKAYNPSSLEAAMRRRAMLS